MSSSPSAQALEVQGIAKGPLRAFRPVMSRSGSEGPIEVEVERLDPGEEESDPPSTEGGFGPVVAGLLLDLADLVTPIGMQRIAVPLGLVVGYYAGLRMGLSLRQRLLLAAVGAAYCSLAATTHLPLGTLVGLLYRAGLFGGSRAGSRR